MNGWIGRYIEGSDDAPKAYRKLARSSSGVRWKFTGSLDEQLTCQTTKIACIIIVLVLIIVVMCRFKLAWGVILLTQLGAN